MPNVHLKPVKLDKKWTRALNSAAKELNAIFVANAINVVVSTKGGGPVVEITMDPNVPAGEGGVTDASWNTNPLSMDSASIRLRPNKDAGAGRMEVILAHEICHALGHLKGIGGLSHSTALMTAVQTWSGDKLRAGSDVLPPIKLSDESIALLQGLWP